MTKAATTQSSRLSERWATLPAHLKVPQQLAGIRGVACGATHSVMERCNFACTSCYLSDLANDTEPLPFDEVRAQLDALRAHLGAGGKVQITSGEVTLLPREELGRIIAYARQVGLDPMVMTNGERLLQVDDYLPALVREHGLRKISFHVDTTQRGRPGMRLGLRESDIHSIRDRFAALVKRVRKETGGYLHAAHTVTVTRRTLGDISQVVRWGLDNLDSFRLLSFLPVASVGRTEDEPIDHLGIDEVWDKICEGLGRRLNRHAMYFGHPECNVTVPLVVASTRRSDHHVVEIVRQGRRWDLRVFRWGLRELARYIDLDAGWRDNAGPLLGLAVRQPHRVAELLPYGLYRLWGERAWWGPLLARPWTLATVRIRPLMLVVHKFMSPNDLNTELGRERLEACVFKVPVDGRMVSMCEVNATSLRRRLNVRTRRPSAQERITARASVS